MSKNALSNPDEFNELFQLTSSRTAGELDSILSDVPFDDGTDLTATFERDIDAPVEGFEDLAAIESEAAWAALAALTDDGEHLLPEDDDSLVEPETSDDMFPADVDSDYSDNDPSTPEDSFILTASEDEDIPLGMAELEETHEDEINDLPGGTPVIEDDAFGIPAQAAAFDPDEMNELFGLSANSREADVTQMPQQRDLSFLRGKTVVLTGDPPKPYTKATIAKLLQQKYGSTVEPIFTSRTQVVMYGSSARQKDPQGTAKLKKAQQAGLKVVPYNALVQQTASTASDHEAGTKVKPLDKNTKLVLAGEGPNARASFVQKNAQNKVTSVTITLLDLAKLNQLATRGGDGTLRITDVDEQTKWNAAKKGSIIQLISPDRKLIVLQVPVIAGLR